MALNMLHLVVGKTRTDKSIICATNLQEIKICAGRLVASPTIALIRRRN